MSAFDSEKPPKREMVTTSGVEVLVDAPLPAAPAARAPRRTSSPASVFIRNLEKKWGKFIRMKLHRPDIPPASAEEMHQEVLVTLFEEYKKQNGPPEHEQAFLDKVILNEIRRHGRRRPEVAQGADVEGVAASAPDPQGAVERVQLWRRLEHHIGELSQQEREVLTAREMHEMTFEVIALMLGRPYGTIVEQHARAMQKLEDIARASERAAARGARRRRRSFEK